jgi:DNA polymerase
MNTIYLDFETRSKAPLTGKKAVGAWRYSIDPTTKPLCLGYAFNNDDPQIWIEGQPQPVELRARIADGWLVRGWNTMSFERAIFENQMKAKLGWVVPELEQYRDTMLDALTLSLPAALADVGRILNIENMKIAEGKKLIQYLCVPISSGNMKGEFRERDFHLQKYIELYHYCKGDVKGEREIHHKLPYHLSGRELARAQMIMRINERGIPIDIPAVQAINEAIDNEKEYMSEIFNEITGIAKATQREKFKGWLHYQGLKVSDLQDHTVQALLAREDIDEEIQLAISCYSAVSSSSNAKYAKILTMLCPDGTIKNNLIFNKANTGRLAGAGFQPQNLPRLKVNDPEFWINCFMDREYSWIRAFYGILHASSALIRNVIKAPYGMKFLSGDLKGIEARKASWVAGEEWMLENFRNNVDAYIATASRMLNIIEAKITAEQRQSGKVGALLGQFGGGYKAIMRDAEKHGYPMTEAFAKQIIKKFRAGRPHIVDKWDDFGNAAVLAVQHPGTEVWVDSMRKFQFVCEGDYLYMILPNKRRIAFPFPELRHQTWYGELKVNVSAMWVNSVTKQWERRTMTGANFFQSAVQASSRDILFEGHERVEAEGLPLIMSVHDEGVSVVPDDDRYTVELYSRLMGVAPKWGKDIPVESDCWEGYRYRK